MNNNKDKKIINYDQQINRMIIHMIKKILQYSSHKGLPGGHHFYIKFFTNHPEFTIMNLNNTPDLELINKHSQEMTIVLQNSFQNLCVEEKFFSVVLNFNGEPKKLIIPFSAISTFCDPFAQFSVKLDIEKNKEYEKNSDSIIHFEEYDEYEFDEEYEEYSEEISEMFRYDYKKYKLDKSNKIVYMDQLKKKIANQNDNNHSND